MRPQLQACDNPHWTSTDLIQHRQQTPICFHEFRTTKKQILITKHNKCHVDVRIDGGKPSKMKREKLTLAERVFSSCVLHTWLLLLRKPLENPSFCATCAETLLLSSASTGKAGSKATQFCSWGKGVRTLLHFPTAAQRRAPGIPIYSAVSAN